VELESVVLKIPQTHARHNCVAALEAFASAELNAVWRVAVSDAFFDIAFHSLFDDWGISEYPVDLVGLEPTSVFCSTEEAEATSRVTKMIEAVMKDRAIDGPLKDFVSDPRWSEVVILSQSAFALMTYNNEHFEPFDPYPKEHR